MNSAPSKLFLVPFVATALLVMLLTAFFGQLHRGWIFGTDAQGNYMVGRSLYFDHDVDFANEFFLTPQSNLGTAPQLTRTGRVGNQTPVGYGLLTLPFFFAADMLTRAANLLRDAPLPNDGYGGIFGFIVPLSSILYAFAGIFFAYRILRTFFEPDVASLAVNSLILSSSLLWYIGGHLTMNHAQSFAFVTLLIFLSMPLYSKGPAGISARRFMGIACVYSIAVMIRFQNAVFGLVPVAPLLACFLGGGPLSRKERAGLLWKIVLAVSAAALCYIPQLLYVRTIYGEVFANTYAATGWAFAFSRPELFKTLFSTDHGLLLWHPILIFALVGIGLLLKRDKTGRMFLSVLLTSFLATWYMIASWDYSMANSFGNRAFDGFTVFFALGWGEVLRRLWKPWGLKYAVLACCLAVLWNLQLLMQQRYLGWIPLHGEIGLGQFFKNYQRLPAELERLRSKYAD